MAETVHIEIPEDDWVELSSLAAAMNGRVSNSGNAVLVYVQAETKPSADSNSGHRLVDDNLFDYVVHAPEALWMRALNTPGIASVTPDLAVDVLKGAMDIHDADVHRRAVNSYVHQHTAIATTISADSSPNDYVIGVANTAGFSAGDTIDINTTTIETTHPTIVGVTPGTPGSFELDRRLDVAHFAGDEVVQAIINLSSQIGTLAAPQEYAAGPPPGEVWHILNLTLAMGHSSAGDFGLFGNLPKLTNGVILRVRINGQYGTLTNWKTNGEINVDTGEVFFHARSGGQGTHGTAANGAFKTRTGATMRLDGDTNDVFEVYVQDDLTGLAFWNMKIQGHIEEH